MDDNTCTDQTYEQVSTTDTYDYTNNHIIFPLFHLFTDGEIVLIFYLLRSYANSERSIAEQVV